MVGADLIENVMPFELRPEHQNVTALCFAQET